MICPGALCKQKETAEEQVAWFDLLAAADTISEQQKGRKRETENAVTQATAFLKDLRAHVQTWSALDKAKVDKGHVQSAAETVTACASHTEAIKLIVAANKKLGAPTPLQTK